MYEQKELILLRIFTTDKYKLKGKPIYHVILEELLRNQISGATVFHGIAGFGTERVIHSAGILDTSEKLPIVIEICENEEKLNDILSIIKKIFIDANVNGFITYEKVKSLIFRKGTK